MDDFVQIDDSNKQLCCGCGACKSICPRNAIEMKEDSEGFLFPDVDESLCVKCSLCTKECTIQKPTILNRSTYKQRYFLCSNTSPKYFKNSATIGLCTMLSESILKKGGVVFGCWLHEERWRAYHIKVEKEADLYKIRNSKYIQSDVNDTYRETKKELESNKIVLYIGTPCQIVGLKSFLRKDYENLYTIDLICHGVYSYKLLIEEIAYWHSKLGRRKIHNFRFRSKRKYPYIKGGIINFDYGVFPKRHIECPGSYSPTYACYAYNSKRIIYNARLSCYSCSFRSESRYGDLTIGDPWGMYHINMNENELKNGRSLVMLNTQRGDSLFQQIASSMDIVEVGHNDAFRQPALLPAHREIPHERSQIYDSIGKGTYEKVVNEVLGDNLWKRYIENEKGENKLRMKRIIKKLLLRNI